MRVLRQILSPLRFSQHVVSVLRTRRRIEIVNRDGYFFGFFGAKTVTPTSDGFMVLTNGGLIQRWQVVYDEKGETKFKLLYGFNPSSEMHIRAQETLKEVPAGVQFHTPVGCPPCLRRKRGIKFSP